jgi:RNA polymerase sigma-70 factor (ECF subfamily)
MQPGLLAEHFFRHQSGRLIATLTRVLGVHHLDLVEDVVQGAFLQALRSWSVRGIPDDPAAWLFRVARNQALDALRRDRTRAESVRARSRDDSSADELLERVRLAGEIDDDQLRLLCLCCHPSLPAESQVAFALRMMCGFSIPEIARALLTSEANAHKRIARAKDRLREEPIHEVNSDDLRRRKPIVLSVIYLLFNEGYNSYKAERLIRVDLCAEALRLGALVADDPACRAPDTCALMALMCFHVARFDARESDDGRLLLLDQQDRSRWDRDAIHAGLRWLWESGRGEQLSPYHLEAAIAAEHCLAATFAETNWPRILGFYNLLVGLRPTPVHRLNRGIAVAFVHGPLAGLRALAQIDPSEFPSDYYLWDSALGELHRRAGHLEDARRHLARAIELTNSPQEQEMLRTRLESMPPSPNPGPTSS